MVGTIDFKKAQWLNL